MIFWKTYKEIDNSAKPPTVYRSLDFLMEHGLIHKIQSLNAYVGCSHPDAHDSCYFLICNECQNIEEHCSININDIVKNNSGGKSFFTKSSDFGNIRSLWRMYLKMSF